VSRYQKGKTNLDFTEARDSEWQWRQLGHMQVCTSFQTDKPRQHPTTQFSTGRMPFLPPNQQLQSTEGKIQVRKQNRNRLVRAVVLWSVQLVVQQCQQPAEMMQMNSATLVPAVHVVLLSAAAAAVPLSDDESVAS